ncbi:lactosylceramide 4-alpha-galactosyltransferase [Hyalella azteca]|uniref:Lactosylceramide 4-alpha-galactosyltransferase n=1 Tax=Hyalella azteca TaxID=294128 RepID=A0A8B7PNF6_HYAAZ|nr:lactosylceramide 4-alpha-galactosyltransferase [Hyalella azteca]
MLIHRRGKFAIFMTFLIVSAFLSVEIRYIKLPVSWNGELKRFSFQSLIHLSPINQRVARPHTEDALVKDGFLNGAGQIPVFYQDIEPEVGAYHIYFMETSSRRTITQRGLCVIESWCSANRNATVWYLVTSATLVEASWVDLMEVVAVHRNLRLAYLDFNLALNDTPLAGLYASDKFAETLEEFLPYNLSDLCRLAVVYKSGGFYSDMDTLALRSVLNLTNFIALYNDKTKRFANAAFHFERRHLMLLKIMQHIADHYDGIIWAYNGPVAIMQTVERLGCDVIPSNATGESISIQSQPAVLGNSTKHKKKPARKLEVCDWLVLKQSIFYPIHWSHSHGKLFLASRKGSNNQTIEEIFPGSYGVHFGDKFMKEIYPQKGSLILKIVRQVCPIIITKHPFLKNIA